MVFSQLQRILINKHKFPLLPTTLFIIENKVSTKKLTYAMMKSLHNRTDTANILEPNEGERHLLCSNKSSTRSPSLDFISKHDIEAMDQFAEMLVDIACYLYEKRRKETSSDLLSGINKRTG